MFTKFISVPTIFFNLMCTEFYSLNNHWFMLFLVLQQNSLSEVFYKIIIIKKRKFLFSK